MPSYSVPSAALCNATQANLHGVLPVERGDFMLLQKSALQWNNQLRQACAVCHSLNMVGKSLAAGADLERALFKAVEARFLVCHRCITTSFCRQ